MNILTTQNASAYPIVGAARAAGDETRTPIPTAAVTAELSTHRGLAQRGKRLSRALRQLASGAMLASLVACGSLPGERAASGAGIGAGAGAAVGAVTGMGVGTGAAIGAAAGAAAGGLTKEEDVNLGKPIWK